MVGCSQCLNDSLTGTSLGVRSKTETVTENEQTTSGMDLL